MEKFWLETKEVLEPNFSEYFFGKESASFFKSSTAQYASEQYVTYACFERNFQIPFENSACISEEILEASRRFIVSNFVVASPKDYGIILE